MTQATSIALRDPTGPTCRMRRILALAIWADSRLADSRLADPRLADPRLANSRSANSRLADPRLADPRLADPRSADPRSADRRLAFSANALIVAAPRFLASSPVSSISPSQQAIEELKRFGILIFFVLIFCLHSRVCTLTTSA